MWEIEVLDALQNIHTPWLDKLMVAITSLGNAGILWIVLAAVLPYKAYNKYMRYEQYIMIALMILLFVGALDGVISTLSTAMMKFISIIPALIFLR